MNEKENNKISSNINKKNSIKSIINQHNMKTNKINFKKHIKNYIANQIIFKFFIQIKKQKKLFYKNNSTWQDLTIKLKKLNEYFLLNRN